MTIIYKPDAHYSFIESARDLHDVCFSVCNNSALGVLINQNMNFSRCSLLLAFALLSSTLAFSQDTKFYIFLALGQSNMEGSAKFEPQDTTVNNRFKVLEAVNCDNLGRKKGEWYTAVPPLARCKTGLGPTDYFGRTLL